MKGPRMEDEDPDRVWSEPGGFSVFYSQRRPYMVSICIDHTATAVTLHEARMMSHILWEAADRVEAASRQDAMWAVKDDEPIAGQLVPLEKN